MVTVYFNSNMKITLKPTIGDMKTYVISGKNSKALGKQLRKEVWEEELSPEFEEFYDTSYISQIRFFLYWLELDDRLEDDIIDHFNKEFEDGDYWMESY